MAQSTGHEEFDRAFEDLFPRAWRLAYRIVGDAQVAEELAAEALTRAYVRWGRLRDATWRDGWVLRVTTNLALDAARRRTPVPRTPPPEDLQEIGTLRVALVAALRALPRRQREVVALRYLTGMSEADVARALGVTPGTVKSHLHRGIAALRAHLGDSFQEDHVIADVT